VNALRAEDFDEAILFWEEVGTSTSAIWSWSVLTVPPARLRGVCVETSMATTVRIGHLDRTQFLDRGSHGAPRACIRRHVLLFL
jgi:hypothetical protein